MSRARYTSFSQLGGVKAVTGSVASVNKFQQSYPGSTVTVFYTGGASGFVSTSGTAVTLISGTPFNANGGWNGLTVTIASVPYIVSTVNSPTSLTLATPAPVSAAAVYSMAANAPAAIYSDNAGTPKANPFTTDSATGEFFLYADDGNYDIRFSGVGVSSPFTLSSQSFFDPSFVNLIPPGDPTDFPTGSLPVIGVISAKNVISDPNSGVGAGGALAIASSPSINSSFTGYLISNWSGGQSGSPATDRYAYNGGSAFIAFGIGTTGDAPQSCIRFGSAPAGNAGDHIVWADKFDIGVGCDPLFPQAGWFGNTPGTIAGGLFIDTRNTIATPGLTPLNQILVPLLPSTAIFTGNENTLACEMNFDAAGNFYIQPRDFAGDSTAHNLILTRLGGKVGIGNISPTQLLDVGGTAQAQRLFTLSDDASAVPSQIQIIGLSNSNQQLLLGYNTTSDYATIQPLKQGVGGKDLRLCPVGGNITGGPINYIASETGANNAIIASSVNALAPGLRILIQLAHSLQAGPNTCLYNGVGPISIKGHRNPANDITSAYVSTGLIDLVYNGSVFLDMSQ